MLFQFDRNFIFANAGRYTMDQKGVSVTKFRKYVIIFNKYVLSGHYIPEIVLVSGIQ